MVTEMSGHTRTTDPQRASVYTFQVLETMDYAKKCFEKFNVRNK